MRILGKIYRRQIHSFDGEGDYEGDYSPAPTGQYPDIHITGDIDITLRVDTDDWEPCSELVEAEFRWMKRIEALYQDWWLWR